ncbi:M36 family metallopeptidase [Flavobacterium caeni]|nr:M36 family metallopeptidase [Flavobacterium caeni]
MKKITLLGVFLLSVAGFAQTGKQKIQAYFEQNLAKYGLTSQDVSDLNIRSEVYGNGSKVTSYRVVQRYQGTDLHQIEASVAIKDGEIFRVESAFLNNIASKVNVAQPSLSVTEALARAYSDLGVSGANFSITASESNKNLTLADGLQEDHILARLVYFPVDRDHLKLAWQYDFYQPGTNNYWTTSVDATNGQIIKKENQLLSCNFGGKHHDHKAVSKSFNFTNKAFTGGETMMEAQGGTYRVLPYNIESPNHGSFQLVSNPEFTASSPNGWHNASNSIGGTTPAQMYQNTRGNNTYAREDPTANNALNNFSPNGGATLTFDFPYVGEHQQPTEYTSAAVTNLFYTVNVIHDIWYQYGFNEAAKNFQAQNYGLGGTQTGTGDYILADAQDGYSQTEATLNNANFTPTAEGVRPRVQMFLWNAGAPPTEYLTINTPASIAGPRVATTNVFEGTDRIPVPTAPNGIVSDLVLYTNDANNGTTTPGDPITVHNACIPPSNAFDISGKIALIRRGNCNFSNKVKNAQDAGALAVIVYDTVPNNPVRLSMSSTGILGITIPAIFVTREIGEEMVAAMATETVNVKLETPADLYLFADGDFDNVIIGHEIGHGISNRLIGAGAAGCMSNAESMGEGWSDWIGLLLQMKTGDTGPDAKTIGTFVWNEDPIFGAGLREFPYSTDMTVNPRTFADSNWPVPADPADTTYRYVVGEFWASVLWDLTWAFVDEYGFDPNIYTGTGGNNMVMQLMVDAMKMAPACNTGNMIGFRDIIFATDQAATGGANYNMMAEVFRRRGMGLNATGGSPTNSNDQTEDFTAFPLSSKSFTKDTLVKVYPNPSDAIFNVRIAQFNGSVDMQVVDLNGRVVFSQTESNFNVEKSINLGHLAKGVYVLKVNTADFNYSDKIILK